MLGDSTSERREKRERKRKEIYEERKEERRKTGMSLIDIGSVPLVTVEPDISAIENMLLREE